MPLFEFDRFQLDITAYELRRSGRKVRLQRVPMDLLILLVERKATLVTREEIASRLWTADSLVDTQSGINTAIRKIRQALGDDGEKPKFIETVVGKGYRFIGEIAAPPPAIGPAAAVEIPAPAANETSALPAKIPRLPVNLATLVSALAAGVMLAALGLTIRKPEPFTIVPFTALPGLQSWPAFSPDGARVAFGWTGETGACSHIYVKDVDQPLPVKLTDGPSCDGSPSWSPDGRSIAFLRTEASDKYALFVIRASGGEPARIAGVRGTANYRPAWTPDGTAIVVMDSDGSQTPPSLFRVSVDSAEKRRITNADPATTGDWCPAFSPDGRTLAYLHNSGSYRLSPLYVIAVDRTGMPAGEPRPIKTGAIGFTDVDWSADGRSLIAATPSGVVRVPVSGGAPEALPFPDGSQSAVASHSNRMVYVQTSRDTDIFRVPGPGRSDPVTRLISSTRKEFAAQYSSDGRRIVFVSDRTGSEELWVADSEGSHLQQITSFAGPGVGSPHWSPDGKWIAFDSTAGGRVGIYVVASHGGAARRITSRATSSVRPSWSRNGSWIYFGSDQSASWQIWKTSPQGGSPVQVTHAGGREALEDTQGVFLYYAKPAPVIGIWRMPAAGGDETQFSAAGTQGHWTLGGGGIYYLRGPDALEFQAFATMKRTPIATPGLRLGESTGNLMSAAPDDRSLLATVLVRSETHLMLVRNFR